MPYEHWTRRQLLAGAGAAGAGGAPLLAAPAEPEEFPKDGEAALERLKTGKLEQPTEIDEMHKKVMTITGDPLPYGIEPNRKVIEELIRHARAQGIVTKSITVEGLFAPSTHALVG